MGLSACQPLPAGHRHGPRGGDDPPAPRRCGAAAFSALAAAGILCGLSAEADVRLATWDAGLGQEGPGLLLHHIRRKDAPEVEAALAMIARLDADVILLTDIDWDLKAEALGALNARLARPYPYLLALRPNAGIPSGQDLDGDGKLGGAGDALAWGRFPGEGGMALLSRLAIGAPQSLTDLAWGALPGADLPQDRPPDLPLSTSGHYVIPLDWEGKTLTLLAYAATAPIFGGPEDRNGKRNADETALWLRLLDGQLGPAPAPPYVLIGKPNLDPSDGEGSPASLLALMARLQDPAPKGPAHADGGLGDPALDTVFLRDGGGLRVDMILPSPDLRVVGSGLLPALSETDASLSRHRPVWVQLAP